MKLTIAVTVGLLCAATQSFGSTLYLTDGDHAVAYRIDLPSGNYLGSFTTFGVGYPIAVGSTVRIGDRDNGTGYEYDLNGVPTGDSFSGGGGIAQLLDGATDGSTYNYGVTSVGSHAVYRGDRLWQGLTSIFTLPVGGAGITYDPIHNSLWVATLDHTIREYSLTGTELSSFTTTNTAVALAYDAAADSFWYYAWSTQSFVNFDRAGSTLNTVIVPGLPSASINAFGGEMAPGSAVPEPGSLLPAFAGVLAVLLRRKPL